MGFGRLRSRIAAEAEIGSCQGDDVPMDMESIVYTDLYLFFA